MAIVRAVKSGNWSDVTVWSTGALPTSADDVYSNTFSVTIDVSPTVLSISNAAATGVTAGGGFGISANGITLRANVLSAGSTVLTVSVSSPNIAYVTGNVTAGTSSYASGINLSGSGTLIVTGNVSGNAGHGITLTQTGGSVTITGNVTGGSGNYGVNIGVVGNVSITGDCLGGTSTNHGVANITTGTVSITGNLIGSPSSSSAAGAVNSSSGTLIHIGSVLASTVAPGLSTGSPSQVTILTGPLISSDGSGGTAAASGVNPCVALRWFPADTALSTFEYRMRGQTVSGSPSVRPARQLFLTDAYSSTYPTNTNVRSGTVYGPGSIYTGTCSVPSAGSVLLGVPVDNTTGTVTITAADIRSAVGLASANLDTQFSNVPANVRTNLSTELARIDTAVSSRLATSGYTAPPTVGDIATAVWNAATSALSSLGTIGKLLVDNINASISSRLATTSYQAPLDAAGTRTAIGLATANLDAQLDALPTATENASAVRTELAPELARIDVATSTRSTFNSATDTVANVTLVATTTNLTNPPDVPTTSEIAEAVRVELTPELNNLDTTVSSRSTFNPATDTVAQVALVDTTTNLTNPPVVPTPEQIAAEVRVELTPELDRIDVDVSSRLATTEYVEPPTSEQNAEAVRVELTPELERVANCATVATTGEQIQDAWARSPNTP